MPSDTYALAQERLGAPLDNLLKFWRSAGVSAPAISRLLAAETRVEVSPQTIRRWLRQVESAA